MLILSPLPQNEIIANEWTELCYARDILSSPVDDVAVVIINALRIT